MKRSRFLGIVLLVLSALAFNVMSQQTDDASCPVLVQDAAALVSELCDGIGRNEVCYGNLSLLAEPQPDVDDLNFDEPGDIEALSRIASLTLAPVNVDVPEWGVALMKVQALLPNTLPGQNVTILLFGDVELRNAVAPGDETLAPMQAFYFQSGIGTTQCAATPTDGILIRATGSTEKVALKINDVTFTLGSTMFFQAQSEDALYMHLLDGESIISAFDETQTLQPGETLAVPLDAALSAAGPPSAPQATDPELAAGLSTVLEMLSTGTVLFNRDHCGEVEVYAGQHVLLEQGVICAPDEATGQQALGGSYPISMDGVTLSTRLEMAYESCEDTIGYNVNARADWIATEGTHVFSSYNVGGPFSCTFTVLPAPTPTSEMPVTTGCVVSASEAVNMRDGPGTNYPRVGVLGAGETAPPDGQATGTDSFTWWRLSGGGWVRADVVTMTGCSSLPVIADADLPPAPTPAPIVSGGTSPSTYDGIVYFNLGGPGTCVANPPIYAVGTTYQVGFGTGMPTAEAAEASMAAGVSSITINGVPMPVYRHRADCPADGAQGTCVPGSPGYHTEYLWTPTEPGTYTITGTAENGGGTCVITIQ